MGTTATYSLPYPAETDAPDGAAQIQSLAEAVDTAISTATGTQFVTPLFARKTTDESRASTTTLANDTSLKLTGLVSGGIYEISMILLYNGGASPSSEGDIKWTFTVPSGSSGSYTVVRENVSGGLAGAYPATWTQNDTGTQAHTVGVSTTMSLTFRGLLVAGANGTLQFQWAQLNSNSTATHVLTNSYITGRRVA